MDSSEPETTDIDQQLRELFDTAAQLRQRCHLRSADRLMREAGHRARSHQRLIAYLDARFHVMNDAQDLLDPVTGREAAVETIALLESEDRARLLQPDFPQERYEETVAWMSACAYDNLAKHTALIQGYNSEGVHACIGEGIEVCRRTGKLRCITCFREYATDVYTASDDLEMALHFARLVSGLPAEAAAAERRWVGAKDEATVLLLAGRLDAAEGAARRALELAPAYHNPLDACLETMPLLESILLLAGRQDAFVREFGTPPRDLPAGESPMLDLRWDRRDALAACCRGDYAAAIQIHTRWDRWLTEHQCLDFWFETRLLLLAAHRLAGNADRLAALGQQLEAKAQKARDWLTLRRLARLLDPDEPASPLALAGRLTFGSYAGSPSAPSAAAPPSAAPAAAEGTATPATPLDARLQEFFTRLTTTGEDPAVREAVLTELIALAPDTVEHPFDAIRLLHLVGIALGEGSPGQAIWTWGRALAARFRQEAGVLNLLAAIGDQLRSGSDATLAESIPGEEVARLFRESLDLDAHNAGNFARAGAYHLAQENVGEAERCLARAFRLNRASSFVALRLADVYNRTERPADALAVLDLCLREGSEDPAVAWQAVLTASNLRQYESVLTYAERFESLEPGQQWIHYYRAVALLELRQPHKALEAVDEEERRSPAHTFVHAVLRAAATAALGEAERCRRHTAEVLAIRLATVDYLTLTGLANLTERLWAASACLSADDPLRVELAERLLVAGLGPDAFFAAERQQEEEVDGVNFYHCTVRQPLDEQWSDSPGCLPGQEGWGEYWLRWGVLARDEAEAEQIALAWQKRCAAAPATVEACEPQSGGYKDRPGVVWQGYRSNPTAAEG
jgi:tetratricopeptide (TPR) repeat protein